MAKTNLLLKQICKKNPVHNILKRLDTIKINSYSKKEKNDMRIDR